MGNKKIGIKRILRILIVACVFAAFAGGQAFAADGWPEGVQDNGIPALVLTIDETEFQNVIESPDHTYSAETGSIKFYMPDGYVSEYTGDELTGSEDLPHQITPCTEGPARYVFKEQSIFSTG